MCWKIIKPFCFLEITKTQLCSGPSSVLIARVVSGRTCFYCTLELLQLKETKEVVSTVSIFENGTTRRAEQGYSAD